MTKKPRITVLGSFVVDLMGRASRLPVPGETVLGSYFKMGPGGKGSNQAVAAQRAGADVTMITKIGEDAFGEMAVANFKAEGMHTDYIFHDKQYSTATALILVDENTSQNQILVTLEACEHITAEEVGKSQSVIETADIFLTQLETNLSAIEEAIGIAHAKGVPVILNPAPARDIPDTLLMKVDFLTPNETEAEKLTGVKITTRDEAIKAGNILMSKGAKNIIITLGSKGCLVMTPGEHRFLEGKKVTVVDTTGAGDAFNGGLATALAEGKDIFQAAAFAGAVAALSVTKIGTAPAMPYRSDIDILNA